MTTPAIEYEQPQPTLGPPKKKRREREAQIETPEQAQAFQQSQAVHELNTRIGNYSPAFITDHPHVVAHFVFSSMSTPKIQALAPYLSQTWETLKSRNAYAGVAGGLIAARAQALSEENPSARQFKLFLLDLLAQQSPDEQQATAALIRATTFRQAYEQGGTQAPLYSEQGFEPMDPVQAQRMAYEHGDVGQQVLNVNPQVAKQYQAEGRGNAILRGLGDVATSFPRGVEDIWRGLLATQQRVMGTQGSRAQEDKIIAKAKEKLAALDDPTQVASVLKSRGLSLAEINDTLSARKDAVAHIKEIATALIEARQTGGGLPGPGVAAMRAAANQIAGTEVGTVKVAWQSTGQVDVLTDDSSSPDAKLAGALAQTLFPGTQVAFAGKSLISAAIHETTSAVQAGLNGVMLPFTAASKLIPGARYLLETPANILGNIGSDVGGAFANAIGIDRTNPLYDDIQNIGALIVQFEGLKTIGKVGEAVKLARSQPSEMTKGAALGASITDQLQKAATEAGFEGRVRSPEKFLRSRLGGPVVGRVAVAVHDLISKPAEKWFDSGVGRRLVGALDRTRTKALEASKDPAGDLIEAYKDMTPDLARQVADADNRSEIRDLLVRRVTRIDWTEMKRLKERDAGIRKELKGPDLSQEDRSSLVAERQTIREQLSQTAPDKVMWDLPKKSAARRVVNAIPNTRLGKVIAALYDPQFALPLGRKAFRVSTLRPLFDDMPKNILYNPGHTDIPAGAMEHNAAWLSTGLRRLGVNPEIIRTTLADMTKVKNDADFFDWMGSVGDAIGTSKHIAPDYKAALTSFFSRTEAERNFGVVHTPGATTFGDRIAQPEDVLVDATTGRALPTMSTELINNTPMPSHTMMIEATSFTRYQVRRLRGVYQEEQILQGQRVKVRKKTPQAVLARTALLPYDTAKLIMSGATAFFKPLILVTRTLGALPLRIQGEQWFRNYFAGRRGFVREAMLGRKADLPVGEGALGSIAREAFTPIEGTRATYDRVPTDRYTAGNEVPQEVWAAVYRRMRMFHEDAAMRALARMGPEDFVTWVEGPGKRYLDSMKPTLDRARNAEGGRGVSTRAWADRKWRELQELTNGDQRMLDAINTGRWVRRGSVIGDAVANQIADPTLSQEHRALETEYTQVMGRIHEEMDAGHTDAVRGLQTRALEIIHRQGELEDTMTERPSESMYRPAQNIDPGSLSVSLDDEWAWTDPMGGALSEAFNRGEYRLPQNVIAKRTVVDNTQGRMQEGRTLRERTSSVMYKGLKPTQFVDRHLTRGSYFYQVYADRFSQAVARGLEPEVARYEAMHRAASETADHLYDLSVRSSAHKFLQNVFWFLPAYQEILTTWLWKLPSRGYWPLGMAWILGDAHAFLGFLHNEGVIAKDPSGNEVIRFPFLKPFFDKIMPGSLTLGDAGNDKSIIFGYPSGANIVSSGLPGISSLPAVALGAYARKYGGMYKGLSDILLPYGMDVSIGPAALNYGYEALTGDPPPWEVFSKSYQQQIHDLAFDDAMAMAYHTLNHEGVKPPKLADYPDTAKGKPAYEHAMAAFIRRWQGEADHIYRGRAFVRMAGSTLFPVSLHVDATYRQSFDKMWSDVTGGQGATKAFSTDQRQQIEDWLTTHPGSVAYRTFRTTAGEKFRQLPYTDTGDQAYYDQFYTGERRVKPPAEYAQSVMAMESYRHYTGQLDSAFRDISPTLNWRVILTHGFEKKGAITKFQDDWGRWKDANHIAAGIIANQSDVWARTTKGGLPVKTFETQRLSDFYSAFGHFANRFTVGGLRDKEYKAVWSRIGALFATEGKFGPANTPLEKHLQHYSEWVKPYYDSLNKLYGQASVLSASGLDASSVYAKVRNVTNSWADRAKADKMPSPESVSWGNLSVQEQRTKRLHWAAEPIGWLTAFQRNQTGYHGAEGRKYDRMFNQMADFDTKFQAYLKSANVSSSSKYYDTLKAWRYTQLSTYAEKNFGKEGLTLFRLGEAAPYVRMRYLGVGQDNPAFVAVQKAVDYITRTAISKGVSPSGSSILMDYYRNWLFPIVADLQNPHSPHYDKSFAKLMDSVGLAMARSSEPFKAGINLYDALFFNQFSTRFVPDNPKAFMDLAGVQGSKYVAAQNKAASGKYVTAQGLALRAAQASGVPEASSWATDPRFWYILEGESGLGPNGTQADVQHSAAAQNPTSTAYGIGQFLDCVPMDTEVLTRQGFKSVEQLGEGEETLGYDSDQERLLWTPILDVVRLPNHELVEVANDRFRVRCTPGHRWLSERRATQPVVARSECPECGASGGRRGRFVSTRAVSGHRAKAHGVFAEIPTLRQVQEMVRADSITTAHQLRVSAPSGAPSEADITLDEAELLGWILGDGHIHRSKGTLGVSVYQSKPEQVEELRRLLLMMPHSVYVRQRGDYLPSYTFYLHAGYARDLLARSDIEASPEAFVLRLDEKQQRRFLHGLTRAEGAAIPSGSAGGMVWRLSQSRGPILDAITLSAYLAGFRPSVRSVKRLAAHHKDQAQVTLARPWVHGAALSVRPVPAEDVWCVRTGLGTWTARQSGQIMLTGNSTWGTVGGTKTSDPYTQMVLVFKYLKNHWGTLQAAYEHKKIFHNY